MDSKGKTEKAGDRRGGDRRLKQDAFAGADKRVTDRRSGLDRRTAPRT